MQSLAYKNLDAEHSTHGDRQVRTILIYIFMKRLEDKQMENIVGGEVEKFDWAGCAEGAIAGFELASTTAVVTGGAGLVAGLVGGCLIGGFFS